MCGICGICFTQEKAPTVGDTLVRMRDTMIHRGPDGAGVYTDESAGFGHRRLSVIDVEGSHQPMSNEDDTVWVVFNGEIYNYQPLRRFLLDRGHKLRTQGDTEVIVHLYEEYGSAFVEQLNGIFAIALWDRNEQSLFLIRDRLGVKPLYYYIQPDHVAFASEIKSLLASPFYRTEINHQILYSFFNFCDIYNNETLFKGIRKLEPGCILAAKNGRVSISKYWDIPDSRNGQKASESGYLEQLDAHLRTAVRRQLISDVSLGAFLSGGVDSSLLVAYMSELSSEPVKTFSIGFSEEQGNEFLYSRWVARRFQTQHYEYGINEEAFLDALPMVIWHHDEPLRYHASVALYVLSKFAKKDATVILSGEGADELFLGYRKYRLARIQSSINRFYQAVVPRSLWETIAELGPKLTKRKIGTKVIRRLSMGPASVALAYSSPIPGVTLDAALNDQWKDQVNQEYYCRIFENAPVAGFLNQLAYADLKTHLVSLLMRQDKMSMAAAIETRVPFLDHELVEFAFSLPESFKVRAQTGKYLVKKLAEQKLSKELIYRRKMGFPVPLTQWLQRGKFRGYLLDVLLDPRTVRRGFFNPSFVERHVRDVESGIWGERADACSLLWTMLNFELWCRCFIDGAACVKPTDRRHEAISLSI
jgi:asparagine synthase (glutamine-hydrolysing)